MSEHVALDCCADIKCPEPRRCMLCGESDAHVLVRIVKLTDQLRRLAWLHPWCE